MPLILYILAICYESNLVKFTHLLKHHTYYRMRFSRFQNQGGLEFIFHRPIAITYIVLTESIIHAKTPNVKVLYP